MIFVDDNTIRIDGVTLPGIYKGVEVITDALVEEQEVEGSSSKPKQATGYEDAKINLDLELYDSEERTAEQKMQQIQDLFRSAGQSRPAVHQLVSSHTSIRGVKQVILKGMTSKETNKNDKITVTLELWEYVPVTISGSKTKKGKNTSTVNTSKLKSGYQSYLSSNRGSAPKKLTKTAVSPAIDNRAGASRGKFIVNKDRLRTKIDHKGVIK